MAFSTYGMGRSPFLGGGMGGGMGGYGLNGENNPYQDAETVKWMQETFEYWRPALATTSTVLQYAAIGGSFFNVVAHAAVALFFLFDKTTGRKLWERLASGSIYEPAVSVYYLLTVTMPELWSVFQYFKGGHDATKRLLAFQVFVLGGSNLYNSIMLASPSNREGHVMQIISFEWLFIVAFILCEDVIEIETPLDSLLLYLGCKAAGFAWCWMVVGVMRALGIARFAKAPPPPEEDADDGAEADKQHDKKE